MKEKHTDSVFRVMTKNQILTNTFWNFYLKDEITTTLRTAISSLKLKITKGRLISFRWGTLPDQFLLIRSWCATRRPVKYTGHPLILLF